MKRNSKVRRSLVCFALLAMVTGCNSASEVRTGTGAEPRESWIHPDGGECGSGPNTCDPAAFVIVRSDDQSRDLRIRYLGGNSSCTRPHIKVSEGSMAITLQVMIGGKTPAKGGSCPASADPAEVDIALQDPLGDRNVVDACRDERTGDLETTSHCRRPNCDPGQVPETRGTEGDSRGPRIWCAQKQG